MNVNVLLTKTPCQKCPTLFRMPVHSVAFFFGATSNYFRGGQMAFPSESPRTGSTAQSRSKLKSINKVKQAQHVWYSTCFESRCRCGGHLSSGARVCPFVRECATCKQIVERRFVQFRPGIFKVQIAMAKNKMHST